MFIIESGFKSRAGYNGARTVYVIFVLPCTFLRIGIWLAIYGRRTKTQENIDHSDKKHDQHDNGVEDDARLFLQKSPLFAKNVVLNYEQGTNEDLK